MDGFHPPKHNNIVFHYNAYLCEKRLALQALGFGSGSLKSADLLHFNGRLTQREKLMI